MGDICVFSKTREDHLKHLKHLKEVLEALMKKNLILKK